LLLAGYFAFFFPKPSRPLISKNEQEQILSPGGPVSALPEKDTTQPILAAAERKTEVIRPKATQASQEKRIVGEVKGIKTEAAANQQDVAVAGIQTKALITMDTVVISFDEAIAIEQPPEISKAAEETEMEKKEDVSRSKAAGVPVATKAQVADFLIVSKDSIPVFNQPGYRDFNDYITRNLTYPARARRQGVEGTVLVRFCVDIHGKIKDVTVIRSAGSLLDDEARRVVEKSPPWIPAYKNEQPVETVMTCPVMFLLHQP
jgi:TonB family protein